MKSPEFLRFTCQTSDSPACAACGKEFVIPLSSIHGVYRTHDGFAAIVICASPLFVCPVAVGNFAPSNHRFIKTTHTWEEVVEQLDGAVANVGPAQMT